MVHVSGRNSIPQRPRRRRETCGWTPA